MQTDQPLAAGDPIATGVIEGACRHLVNDRMERSGRRWTLDGARAMLGIRAVQVNGNYQEYQRFRIAAAQQRMHPLRSQFLNASKTKMNL